MFLYFSIVVKVTVTILVIRKDLYNNLTQLCQNLLIVLEVLRAAVRMTETAMFIVKG